MDVLDFNAKIPCKPFEHGFYGNIFNDVELNLILYIDNICIVSHIYNPSIIKINIILRTLGIWDSSKDMGLILVDWDGGTGRKLILINNEIVLWDWFGGLVVNIMVFDITQLILHA